ncbi:MAG: ABC transporter permease subunit [Planctomycetes bacterium]|nr:ABC transporter permease subunit [Planctomycetota bacterium]
MVAWSVCRREMDAAACSGRVYMIRTLFLLVPALILAQPWQISGFFDPKVQDLSELARLGHRLYGAIFTSELVFVSLLAPLLTTGLVVRERDQRTLELLLLSPLTASEILFGKLAAAMADLGAMLFLAAPILAAAVGLGGTRMETFLIDQCCVFVCGVWAGTCGLVFSVLCRRFVTAALWTYASMCFQSAIVLLLLGAGGPPFRSAWTWGAFGPLAYSLVRVSLQSTAGSPLSEPWPVVLVGWTLVSCLLVRIAAPELAASTVRPSARVVVPQARRLPARGSRLVAQGILCMLLGGVLTAMLIAGPRLVGATNGRGLFPLVVASFVLVRIGYAAFRPAWSGRRIWDRPLAWQAAVQQRTPALDFAVELAVLVLAGLIGVLMSRDVLFPWDFPGDRIRQADLLVLETGVLLFFVMLRAGPAAARCVEGGRLETLALTPLRAQDFVSGQWLGLGLALAPLAVLLLLHAALAGAVWGAIPSGAMLRGLVQIAAILYCHVSLGMHLGVWLRNSAASATAHVGLCLTVFVLLPLLAVALTAPDVFWHGSLHLDIAAGLFPDIDPAPGTGVLTLGSAFEVSTLLHAELGFIFQMWTLHRLGVIPRPR